MIAKTTTDRRFSSVRNANGQMRAGLHARKPNVPRTDIGPCRIEGLETRVLLSGWTTVDDYRPAWSVSAKYGAITSDAAGNLYAVGLANDGISWHEIVREKPQGSSTWTTVTDVSPSPTSYQIVDAKFSANGDLYIAINTGFETGWIVERQAAGQSGFTVVDQLSGGHVGGLTIDADGNVFAVGNLAVTTTVKRTQTTSYSWIVRKQTGGTGAFAPVDSYRYSDTDSFANGATSIAGGSAAGLYVVGSGNHHHLVRKSIDGGLTWSLVDDFVYQAGQSSVAYVVTGDGQGNVYVAGAARTSSGGKGNALLTTYWTVRKSSTGAAGSWSPENAVALGSNWFPPSAIQSDTTGKVYVAGEWPDPNPNGYAHSVVRSNRSGSWQTEDDFRYPSGGTGIATGLARDNTGNIFVAGYGQDPSDAYHSHAFVRSPVAAAQASTTFSTTVIAPGASDPLKDLLGTNDAILV